MFARLAFLVVSVLFASCSILEGDDGEVSVTISPDAMLLNDDAAFTITVSNASNDPVWYKVCGQVQEMDQNGVWVAMGVVQCYLDPEGVRIGPGKTFSETVPLSVQETGRYRLVANVVGRGNRALPADARTTNAVTVSE